MSRHVNSISGRFSLRTPQRQSLEILHRVMELAEPHKTGDVEAAPSVTRSEFATVEDFERAFPSLCFALATGVGKTRLMGAFMTYQHLEHGVRHFFVLAPKLTHATENKGKPWRYALIAHDAIADNMTVASLAKSYTVAAPKDGG